MKQLSETFGKDFWGDTLVRTIKTFAQALLAVLGASAVGFLQADWVGALSAAGMAAVLCILTAVSGAQAAKQATAAVGDTPEDYVPERALYEDTSREVTSAPVAADRTKTMGG